MAPTLKFDPFGARDTFDTGSGKAGIYRLSKLESLGLGNIDEAAVLDSRAARIGAAQLRRLRGDRRRREDARRLERRRAGEASKFPSSRPAWCCRISPACPAWSIWPRCGRPCSGWAAIPRRSTR